MSKCLLYSDWLVALGGGERYLFALVDALSPHYEIVIAAPELPSRRRMADLGFPSSYPLRELPRSSLEAATASFELFIHLTTRLPMPTRAQRSFAVVQFPMDRAGRVSCWRHPKARLRTGPPNRSLSHYQFVVYSEFVRRWLHRRWGVTAEILRPPLCIPEPPPLEELLPGKTQQIISVGRFFGDGSTKRQDALIEAYRSLPQSVQDAWPLALAGVVAGGARSRKLVQSLQKASAGANVHFYLDQPPKTLDRLYQDSSLFWHAAGFGRPDNRPERAEHFGMVTVEAMSRAAVPLVFRDGGQAEIVSDRVGSTWSSQEELVAATLALTSDESRRRQYQTRAYEAASTYRYQTFERQARQLFSTDCTSGVAEPSVLASGDTAPGDPPVGRGSL